MDDQSSSDTMNYDSSRAVGGTNMVSKLSF